MSTDLNTMTIKELIQVHNSKAILPEEHLTSWKRKKAELVDLIESLADPLDDADVGALDDADEENMTFPTIRACSEYFLLKVVSTNEAGQPVGMPLRDILEEVFKRFPDANTTVKCLSWYATRLNSSGEHRMPIRPRARAKKPQAVEDTPIAMSDLEEGTNQ